jgi:hypothetical protein
LFCCSPGVIAQAQPEAFRASLAVWERTDLFRLSCSILPASEHGARWPGHAIGCSCDLSRAVQLAAPARERKSRGTHVCSNRAATRVNDLNARERCRGRKSRSLQRLCKLSNATAMYRTAFARRRAGVRIVSAVLLNTCFVTRDISKAVICSCSRWHHRPSAQ